MAGATRPFWGRKLGGKEETSRAVSRLHHGELSSPWISARAGRGTDINRSVARLRMEHDDPLSAPKFYFDRLRGE